MMDCSLTRGPCSAKPAPDAPPCPPPPRKPFPWIYLIILGIFLVLVALLYQVLLYFIRQSEIEDKPEWRPRQKKRRPISDRDLPQCVPYLIIGAGSAGWAAYESIMKHDKIAKVFIITKEDCMPYKRYPMSKHMWWNEQPPDMRTLNYLENMFVKSLYYVKCKKYLDPVKFYRQKIGPVVSFAQGWCVIRIDVDEHIAWLKTQCGERKMYYERALLAPGSKPKSLAALAAAPATVRKKVSTFRTIRDLELSYRRVREAKHITIIGGGFLGAELAWYISRMHHSWTFKPENFVPVKITHIIKDAGILASVLPSYLSEWASERLKCENVQVVPKMQVYDFYESKDNRVQLTLSDGSSLVTDFVLLCIGTVPREELAPDSYLELDPINGGFMANTELEIRKHLYTAGDAASIYFQWKDTRLRFEHHVNAIETGTVAGSNMTGLWNACNMEPYFEFKLGQDLQIESVGEVGACMPTIALYKPCEDDAETVRYDMKRGEFGKPCYKQSDEYKNRYKRGILFYLRDTTIVGIVFWNMTDAIEDRKAVATEVLRAKPSFQDINILAEILGFSSTKCTYIPEDEIIKEGPCFEPGDKKEW